VEPIGQFSAFRVRRWCRFWVGVAVALVCIGGVPSLASADTPVLPTTDSLPWTDPTHHSPLEDLATSIASRIAQRSVRVYCDGETDWEALGASREFDPNGVSGFVDPPHYYYPSSRTFYDSADITHLSPGACRVLWQYGMASAKPTKCPTVVTQEQTVVRTVYVTKKVKVRVKVKGKWVTRTKTVRVPKHVSGQVPVSVDGPPAPCYRNGALAASASADYRQYVFALQVLAHESIHLLDMGSGGKIDLPFEVRAECLGMQWLPTVATSFGATVDDARAIAEYYYAVIYPTRQGLTNGSYPYWSADCRQDGPLDLSPGDGIWP
jgi:hypothetical protein